MKTYFYGFIISIQFFSVLPIRKEIPMTNRTIERAIRMFPLFGLLLGSICTGLLYGLTEWTILSPLSTTFILWVVMIVLTGGIHLDGWMDTSDAFFSYRDQHKRLEIMNDPRTGAFGVISVIVLLAARFLFMYEIVARMAPLTFLLILFIPFFSRMVMGLLLVLVPPARDEEMGKLFQQASNQATYLSYLAYFPVVLVLIWLWNSGGAIPALLMLLGTVILFLVIRNRVMKWFGGMTGDIIGASTEGVEVWLWLIIWLFHYYGMG
ncbi:adenosylcobinamide-GDP ribazoletransferase [Virgibacillus ihumii]|uniref:adenosylcobinamide-GDP ribazoletransferase n=1 Tax=Virgibacillus ihumii TaxID=2686091 RepID=UPI00157D312E|nr:adenosylcobinamide-GDP ribazoletransferase [Virgibacillus ihumii]